MNGNGIRVLNGIAYACKFLTVYLLTAVGRETMDVTGLSYNTPAKAAWFEENTRRK